MNEIDLKRALLKANRSLAMKAQSIAGMRSKLLKNFDEDVVETVIEFLIEKDFLNDRRFAEEFVYFQTFSNYYGKYRIRQMLKQHGISEDISEEIIAEYDDSVQERIFYVLERKYSEILKEKDYNKIQKVKSALLRRGFSYEEINKAVKNFSENLQDENEDYE